MSSYYRPPRKKPDDFDVDIPNIDVERELRNLGGRMPIFIVAALIVLLIFLLQALPTFYTDWQWFKSLGQGSVFTTRIIAQLAIFSITTLGFFILFMINILVARRLAPPGFSNSRPVLVLSAIAGVVLAVFMGLIAQSAWEPILRYLNATPFNTVDPVFSKDVSFFVFTLPVYTLVQTMLTIATVVIAASIAVVYALALGRFRLTPGVKAHFSALGAIFLLLVAWSYQLSIFNLAYSTRGVVSGASYTDVHAQWPAFSILTWLTVLAAVILLVNVVLRATKALAFTAGAWIVVTLLVAQVYPGMVQNFEVRPNELTKEQPYILNNIKLTRLAYGLDMIADEQYPGEGTPTTAEINRNADTVADIRLWDYRPLLDTYNQLQSIRPYYDFRDIDIDRYTINGKYRQVMLAARELTQSKLPSQAQTWVNQKLVYTHGYGVAMSPVNAILADGSPDFFVKNLPPTGDVKIDRPAIYFGEKMDGYVIVKTRMPEFDYPLGDTNATTSYAGADGVGIGSWLNRMLFSLRFGDTNILLSNAIQSDSRVLMHRQIQERIRLLAPFLALDHDPYVIIADGKLLWMQDAYTTSDRFPFSQPHQAGFNYIRNSVKITIDAYDGSTTFYVADEQDPILKSWQGIFPTLFTPMSQMPASVFAHIRYPEDMFIAQAEMLRTYHMRDAQVFYNKEDLWAMPREIYGDKEQAMEPYFSILRLPDGEREEFILLLPFTPNNKQNMVAWLGAKSDGEDYGKRVLYQMPKDKLVYGPMQVEARISQDTSVSSQVSLWSQRGSTVIRGNLLIIPIEKSFLYVEPLYLLAEQGQIPQLKRVIVSTSTGVVMDENLNLAMSRIFSGFVQQQGGTPPGGTPAAPGSAQPPLAVTPDIAALIKTANDQYQQAQNALKAGDWTAYGTAQSALAATLKQLSDLADSK